MTELTEGPTTGKIVVDKVDKVDYRKLAGALLEAVDIYEASYVPGEMADRKVSPGQYRRPGRYSLDYGQAAARALPDDEIGARLIELLMLTAWNDAQDWARKIL